jgi:predicted  nucleic acid-binding Zn-ribbon protein
VSPELSKLIELQELDLEMQRVADRLADIPAERSQVESNFNQYAVEFLALKSRYEQTLEDRSRLDAELLETQQNHEKYKQDLMRVRNEKEYVTALREIDATRKHVSRLETEILKSMEELEKLEAEVTLQAPDIEKKRGEVDHELRALESESAAADQRLASIGKRRAELAESIPKKLVDMYERVSRGRRGQALSEVRNSTCTACRMRVRPKVFSDVRRGDQLITCDNCSRILFYRPDTSKSAEAVVS